jgi:hypothetical protein
VLLILLKCFCEPVISAAYSSVMSKKYRFGLFFAPAQAYFSVKKSAGALFFV